MTTTIQTLLPLLAVLVVVAIIARRLNVAPSILLVIAGIGLALAPRPPHIELAPELVHGPIFAVHATDRPTQAATPPWRRSR
jgi:hypothetical protein